MIRWAVFASGQGTNLANFLRLESHQLKNSQIVAIHCNRECAAAEKARNAGKDLLIASTADLRYEETVLQFLSERSVDQIFLLGYMKVLKDRFFELWKKPIFNLHPSLLPHYKGLNAIARAYEDGCQEFGVSIHEVIPDLDSGKIKLQAKLAYAGESLEEIERKIHQLEYQSVEKFLMSFENPKWSL